MRRRYSALSRATGTIIVLILAGCTTVGMNTREQGKVDYGPQLTMRICILKNDSVSPERATAIVATVGKKFEPFGITVEVPWTRPWTRPGFQVSSIMADVEQRDLEAPCDRLVGLVARNSGDFAWGLLLPEVLGAVDDDTFTHGYVVANYGSLNQLFVSPGHAAVHEFYHLLGCSHDLTLTKCYHRIAALKAAAVPGADFFPGVTHDGKFLTTREAANRAMRDAIAERREKAKQQASKKPDGGQPSEQ